MSAISRNSAISGALPRVATRWIIAAVIAAFIAKTVFAMTTFGTNDILFYHASWQRSLAPDGGIGLYRDGIELVENGKAYHKEDFRNPPFVINILRAAGWLTDNIAFHFFFWLKMASILADAGILLVLWLLLKPHTPAKQWALLIVAVSPVSYLISGFHGSTDAVMIFFVLLSLLVFQRVENPFYAGLAYGMSMNIKIWPLLLIPAVLAWLLTTRRRA
ncbi:MAG: glycosyltransferase family 39 protein, partial [Bryobacterales bacterium]|nr:glycosyltransferase family 39 protein [Bryobacterales bacterium]